MCGRSEMTHEDNVKLVTAPPAAPGQPLPLWKVWVYSGFNLPVHIRAASAEITKQYCRQFGNIETCELVNPDRPEITVTCDDNSQRVATP